MRNKVTRIARKNIVSGQFVLNTIDGYTNA